MKKMKIPARRTIYGLSLLLLFMLNSPNVPAGMNDYCAIPPFVGSFTTPNVLLMLDNSASMFDLQYADKGAKAGYCSITTSQACGLLTPCPSGESCVTQTRDSFYCYDHTYNSNNAEYAGYFESSVSYDYDLTNEYFIKAATFPAATECTKYIPDVLCVSFAGLNVTKFVANGNYLNWLTASKFDVEKKILTGGKYEASPSSWLVGESRGCVGRTFIKEPLSTVTNPDGNYIEGGTNDGLGITFGIKGAPNPYNEMALSPGGQTYIEIYNGDYNQQECQAAVDAFIRGHSPADIKQAVSACLTSATVGAYCSDSPDPLAPIACPNGDADCDIANSGTCNGGVLTKKCSLDSSRTCATDAGCALSDGVCAVGAKQCAVTSTLCSIDNDCIASDGSCTSDGGGIKTCKNSGKDGNSCQNNGDCNTNNGPCVTPNALCTAPAVNAEHACTVNSDCNTSYGLCVTPIYQCTAPAGKEDQDCTSNAACNNNYGTCLSGGDTSTKQKVVFSQTIQACWAAENGKCSGGTNNNKACKVASQATDCPGAVAYCKATPVGRDEANTVMNQCTDLYNENFACVGGTNKGRSCTSDTDCPLSTCKSGPDAVMPGNPALICGNTYAGICYSGGPPLWQKLWTGSVTIGGINYGPAIPYTDSCIIETHKNFCSDTNAAPVTDPTDAPSETSNYDNLPAILGDIGLEAQLRQPLVPLLKVRIKVSTPPSGLLQQFSNVIRFGAMKFNEVGSKTECEDATNGIPCRTTCSNDRSVSCGSNMDCPDPKETALCNVNSTQDNYDGSQIINYPGWGYCYNGTTKTATRCTTERNCTVGQTCEYGGVGDHATPLTLINNIDNLKGTAWTPFGEAFYNAIGYFGQASDQKSRTDLRVNATDFNTAEVASGGEKYNPSEKYCQSNYVVLITDGMSTADRFPKVEELVTLYPSSGEFAVCDKYAGSSSLDNLAYIAYNKNINDPNLFVVGGGTDAKKPDQKIITFVVMNGPSNGDTDANCNSRYLLRDTAVKGGSGALVEAERPQDLYDNLLRLFQDISRKAASGSAVSVLTTSSRGVGSMLQAYFLPLKEEGNDAVNWLGYTQNIWIDPADDLREDTVGDSRLILDQDRIMRLYFDVDDDITKAALFTDDGLAQCIPDSYKEFSKVSPLWEGGKKLALTEETDSSQPRTIFTAVPGGAGMNAQFGEPLTVAVAGDSGSNATIRAALNADATYTASEIVKYTRGQALEDPIYNTINSAKFRKRLLPKSFIQTGVTDPADTLKSVWKLGDVINSTPKVVGNMPQNTYFIDYGDTSYYLFTSSLEYQKRTSVAIIGANDGMLHGFQLGYLKDEEDEKGTLSANVKALFRNIFDTADTENDDLGKEIWAYIPYNALPYLKYYASPDYGTCHIYSVDLSVKVYDASIGPKSGVVATPEPNSAKTKDSWRTILLGGMRFGGACSGGDKPTGPPLATTGFSSFFALDITDPTKPVPLWEFNDADLGYSMSSPAIVRTGDPGTNGNHYIVFGTGPTQLATATRDIARSAKRGYIYIRNLYTGEHVKKINLGHYAIVSDILAIDNDKNYHSEKLYFGTSYCGAAYTTSLDGAKVCSNWKGKVMSIDIPNQDLLTWTLPSPAYTVLFDGGAPVTASPDATKDTLGNVWVYAGTGKYFSGTDQTDTTQQMFVGFIDRNLTVSASSSATCPAACPGPSGSPLVYPLCDVTNCETTATVPTTGGTVEICTLDSDPNSTTEGTFQKKTIVTAVTNVSSAPQSSIGWMLKLPTKEKVISRPLAVGGVVDFLSYKPSADICEHGGDSYLYALDFTTGVAPSNMAIRALGSTVHKTDGSYKTEGDVLVKKSVRLGPGAPPTGEAIIIKENKGILKKKIQVATGVIVETENKPLISVESKIIHWLSCK